MFDEEISLVFGGIYRGMICGEKSMDDQNLGVYTRKKLTHTLLHMVGHHRNCF